MYKTIIYEENKNVATVTLNRPEYGNAFSAETYQEIIDVMNDIDQNDDIHVVILTGAGKYFCSGGDVRFFQQMIDAGESIKEEQVLMTGRMIKSILQNSKPVIAAINGVAAGAGLGLALACDFIVMGESSQLVTAFINMAFPGDTGLIYTMQQALGTFRTKKHVMLNEPIDAELASAYGLTYDVVPDQQLMQRAEELALQITKGPAQALAHQKALMAELFYPDIDEFNEQEAKYMHLSSKHPEHKEAVGAFLAKRSPNFKG